MSGACTCQPPHARQLHRRGVGRCLVRTCQCLYAPNRTSTPHAEPAARGRATVDESGLVVTYSPPEHFKRAMQLSEREKLERRLWRKIAEAGLPPPDELEYRWARSEGRQFRADAFYRSRDGTRPGWLIEVDGGIWMPQGGGHSHPMHLESQHQRDNLASLMGYGMLRFTERQINSGEAIDTLNRALNGTPASANQMLLPSTIGPPQRQGAATLRTAPGSAASRELEP